ncbi:golgi membrane protein [Fusarium pseudoanthophilum]|uniref:Protein YIP n=1 Tax=Fusarium pseudoanthophilum TaxID=48495 RepID=A0A8H5UWF3_9HYPO|nr:golgi membrane protein [Fusarium pseudoanthophilum]
MSNYYSSQQPQYPAAAGPNAAQNLQFFPSQYTNPTSSTPQQAAGGYGYSNQGGYGVGAPAQNFAAPAFGAAQGVSGRMGEQGGLRTGWVAAFSSEGYDGEPPLLEELGVNFGHIQAKTLAVLNPFRRIDSHIMDDSDLAGPLIFFLLFGFILLFSGQVHFGYIYGLAALGSISLHLILSLMSPSDASEPQVNSYPQYSSDPSAPQQPHDGQQGGHFSATLTYPRSASVLGYCLLPLVATSLFGIVMRMDTPVGIVATTAAILWCTYSASGMFCAVGQMKRMRGLVAYPLALFYVGFGIMGIFSSRGSGTFSNAAAKLNA